MAKDIAKQTKPLPWGVVETKIVNGALVYVITLDLEGAIDKMVDKQFKCYNDAFKYYGIPKDAFISVKLPLKNRKEP